MNPRVARSAAICVTGLVVLNLLIGCGRPAAPDASEARRAAAQRYITAVPMEGTLDVVIEQCAGDRQGRARDDFIRLVSREVRRDRLNELLAKALEDHFTAAEIDALAAFNGSPEGQSIQRKIPAYMADLLPAVQQEMDRVLSMTNAALARLQWETRLKEFKAGVADESWDTSFPFVNAGTAPVTIKAVHTSCGCTSARPGKEVYEPGESGEIHVRFEFGTRTGHQVKTVTVETDDPSEPRVRLQIEGDIPEVLRIDPRYVFWNAQTGLEPRTSRVAAAGSGAVTISGIVSTQHLFETRIEAREPGRRYDLVARPLPSTNPVHEKVTLAALVGSNATRRFSVVLGYDPRPPE